MKLSEPVRLDQMAIVIALSKELERQLGSVGIESRHMNAMVAAANLIVDEFNRPRVDATPGMGLVKWLRSDDTGLSSLWMAKVLCSVALRDRLPPADHDKLVGASYNYPHDSSDFGRCHKFLEAVRDDRLPVPEMIKTGPEWESMVAHWDELTRLYLAGKRQELTNRLRMVRTVTLL